MGELGQLLRATREDKDVTLEQVETTTRIREKYLVALEEAKYDDLPTPGLVHGFLRNYATYLGLDVGEVESMYAKETSSRRLFEPGIFHPKDISLSPPRPLLKADLILGIVVTLVVVVTSGWTFWQYGWPLIRPTPTPTQTPTATTERIVSKPSPTATSRLSFTPSPAATSMPSFTPTDTPASPTDTPVPPTATSTEPAPLPTPTATLDSPLPIATPTSSPTDTPTPTPTRVEGVVLKIEVIERAWLQVTVDDQEQPGELLEAEEEREWKAKTKIYLVCGNAGGILVTVNGEELGTLGERAEVVERTWTPEGEMTPTPATSEETPTVTPTATTIP